MIGRGDTPPVFSEAIRAFWDVRLQQREEQRLRGVTDQGTRGAVTGGQQLNGFLRTIAERCVAAGVRPEEIYAKTSQGTTATTLPGYFRAAKDWDLVIVRDGRLLAAIETKSQVGPSFGNNYNNRSEEAIGSATDLWKAYRERAFQDQPAPWLGYLFVLSDEAGSRSPVRERSPHFPVFPVFRGASYARRYEELCRRLMLERTYNATCFLLTSIDRAYESGNYDEPAPELGAHVFLDQLLRSVAP